MTKRSCILVLGMHRSGTSALTRVLNLLGAKLPEALLGPNKGNELGHWEPIKLVALNDKLMAECGSKWDDIRPLDLKQLTSERQQYYKTEILSLIKQEYGNASSIIIKDPRICRFANLYIETLEDAGWQVTTLLPFRTPLDVAQSLSTRDGMPVLDGTLLWLRHVLDAEYHTRKNKRLFFEFQNFLNNPAQIIKAISKITPENALNKDPLTIESAINFIQPERMHHVTNIEMHLESPIARDWPYSIYSVLNTNKGKDLSTNQRKTFDSLRQTFDVASNLISIGAANAQDIKRKLEHQIDVLSNDKNIADKKNTDHLATNAQLDKLLKEEKKKFDETLSSNLLLSKKLEETTNENLDIKNELQTAKSNAVKTAQKTQLELKKINELLKQSQANLDRVQSELAAHKQFKLEIVENSALGIIRDTARGKEDELKPLVSVIIPVKNGLPEFQRVIDALKSQVLDEQYEVIIIDSGSKDGSIQAVPLEDPRFRLIEIESSSFGHGKTRNLGVEKARGEFCAFLTHDATPADKFWIQNIIKPLRKNKEVAGVFGRHIAYEHATPFTKWELETHFSGLKNWPEVHLNDAREYVRNQGLRQVYHFYSDNASCMRKSVWKKHPYPNVNFAEDQLWAKEIVEAGFKKAFAWDAVVYHSHDYSIWERFQRSYDESLALNEYFGYEFCPTKKQLFGQTFKTTIRDMKLALKHGWWFKSPVDTIKKPFDNFARQVGYYMGTTRSEFAKKHDKKFSRDRQMQSQ